MMVCLLKTAFGRSSFGLPAQPCMQRVKILTRKGVIAFLAIYKTSSLLYTKNNKRQHGLRQATGQLGCLLLISITPYPARWVLMHGLTVTGKHGVTLTSSAAMTSCRAFFVLLAAK